MATPTVDSVLETLPRPRLVELGRSFGVGIEESATREHHVATLTASGQLRLAQLVTWMGRDELRRACERHGLAAKERARPVLAARLLEAAGSPDSARPLGLFGARPFDRHAPRVGDVVRVRQRQYLVEGVVPPPEPTHATVVELVCLDDDNQGRQLSVLWELELGARVLHPEAEGLRDVTKLDPPRHFAAYLHALRWNTVTATDARLFQSPFRAGITEMAAPTQHRSTQPLEVTRTSSLALPAASFSALTSSSLPCTAQEPFWCSSGRRLVHTKT